MKKLAPLLVAVFFFVRWMEVTTTQFQAVRSQGSGSVLVYQLPYLQRMQGEEKFGNFREANNFYQQFTSDERKALRVELVKRSECESVKEVQLKPQKELPR